MSIPLSARPVLLRVPKVDARADNPQSNQKAESCGSKSLALLRRAADRTDFDSEIEPS